MKKKSGFPPGLGWLPLTIAVVLVLAVSIGMLIPQFTNHKIAVIGGGGAGGDTSGDAGSGDAGSGDAGGGGAGGAGGANGSGGGAGKFKPGGAKPGTTGTNGTAATNPNGYECGPDVNGGDRGSGVSATEIHIATTTVTTGTGAGFLGQAVDGMQVAINDANNQGGICGRRIVLTSVNSGWDATQGGQDIDSFINSGQQFALVGEPDSEGLGAAISSGSIDRAGMPVVGTDGMLKNQYKDSWVWPVAASTVSNMHIIAQQAVAKYGAGGKFGIVYDTKYKFGTEGAEAFDHELSRQGAGDISGYPNGSGCSGGRYCGISSDDPSYQTAVTAFNAACSPCDLVVMLLEPAPMKQWMDSESGNTGWYKTLNGGEPLFDTTLAQQCPGCGGMTVWTGYHPPIQPFAGEGPVSAYAGALHAAYPNDDTQNEFTEGAYLGTQLFLEACRRNGPDLTRDHLKTTLNAETFDLGLSTPLQYGDSLPHLSNKSMAAFGDNYQGQFNGWQYLNTNFIADPHPGSDL